MRPPHARCPGPSRRELLRAGVLSTWGLGLGDLFRLRAGARQSPTPPTPTRATSCILVWLAGGPSHLDTFDPKPDAPADIRGEFKAIDTRAPGLRISEVLPRIAQIMDKASLVRGLTSPEADHDRAAHHLLTGYRPGQALVYPGYGSVVAKIRGSEGRTLPPHAAIPDAPIFSSSGYLTPAFDPFAVGGDPSQPGFRVRDLSPPDRLTMERLKRRRSMVKSLDSFADEVGQTTLTASRDKFADQAYDLLTSADAQSAFDIAREADATRDRYGRNPLGQGCLLARRLVERGVSFVTVNDRGPGALHWDTHAQNFKTIKDTLAPPLDQGVSALIADLDARGMLDSTLVVVMGEFGRTPRVNPNAGRDHHGRANVALMAGGGVVGGRVVGKTDASGDIPSERPSTPSDIAATIYAALGIDPERRFETPDGQPIRLVETGKPIRELL